MARIVEVMVRQECFPVAALSLNFGRKDKSMKRMNRTATQVRPFRAEDIPQVGDLHRRVFETAKETSPELEAAYRDYLQEVFLNYPEREEGIEPLVYHEKDGRITGFLGVIPKTMTVDGRTVKAALSSQFVAEAGARVWAGPQLLATFFGGPQDLSFGDEANNSARRLWEALGGATSFLQSMWWVIPLRPCKFALCASKYLMKLPPLITKTMSPACGVLDAFATRWMKARCCPTVPSLVGEEADVPKLLEWFKTQPPEGALRTNYSERALGWLLKRADRMERHGRFHKFLLKANDGRVVGSQLCYLNRGGVSEVIQLGAEPRSVHEALEHAIYQAWCYGSAGIGGRLDPLLMQALADKRCLFYCRPWMLVHSKSPDLLRTLTRGEGCMSRLDGEWCLRFQ